MIDKICDKLMKRIRAKMPEVDDERAEVIRYGLELIIGELPKSIVILGIALLLGIFKYTILSILIIMPYRYFSGGLHLKTHIGCIVGTTAFYIGNVYISKLIVNLDSIEKIFLYSIVFIFSIYMITLYAPADTENVPILRKKDRKIRKICSYIVIIIMLILSLTLKNVIIKNMFIIGMLFQSVTISKLAYCIFNVKFGYLEYIKAQKNAT